MTLSSKYRRWLFSHIAFAAVLTAAVVCAAIGIPNAGATTLLYDPPDIDGTADTVRDEEAPVQERLKAAAEVLRFGFEPAIPEVMALLRGLYDHPSAQIRRSAVAVLHAMRLPSAEGFDLLTEALRDPSPAVRTVAVTALIRRDYPLEPPEPRLPGAESFDLLAEALRDPSPDVREAALRTVIQVASMAPLEMRERVIDPAIFAGLAEGRDESRKKLIETIKRARLWYPSVGRGLAKALHAEDAGIRKMAARVIPQIDPQGLDAVVELARLTEDSQLEVREEAAKSLGRIHRDPETAVPALADFLNDPSPEVRFAAAEALQEFGAAAAPEIPALQRALEDPVDYVREGAAAALEWIDEAFDYTEPALIELLENPDVKSRKEAINHFYWVARDAGIQDRDSARRTMPERPDARWLAGASLEAIMKATHDPDEDVAVAAISALGRLGPPSDDVIGLLLEKRDEGRSWVRKRANHVLRHFGLQSREAEPELTTALRSADKDVRASAYRELQSLGLSLGAVTPVLTAIVEEESGAVREVAARELRRVARRSELAQVALENVDENIGQPATADMRPMPRKQKDIAHLSDEQLQVILEEQLRQPRPDELRHSASIVVPISRNGRVGAIEEMLLAHLRDPDFGVRTTTVESLRILDREQAAFVVPVLMELVRLDEHAQVREAAAFVLGKLGPGRLGAVEALTAALSDDQAYVRHSADFSLSHFGREAAPAIPALIGLLDDMLLDNCGVFGGRLSKIDRPAAEALLVERMQDDRRKVRRNAIAAFAGLGGLDTEFRDRRTRVLVAALEGVFGSGIEQVVAARSLYRVDLKSFEVKRAALSAMDDDDHRVRNAMLSLFRNREIYDDSIVSAVEDALNDSHPEVRPEAAYTLAKITPFTAAPAIRAALEREQDSLARERFVNTLNMLEKY